MPVLELAYSADMTTYLPPLNHSVEGIWLTADEVAIRKMRSQAFNKLL
jgi:hypothetical protein